MIQLNPEIMKRSLPPSIHATIDQVTANVNAAVDEIINRFAKSAEAAIQRIEKGEFTADIAQALDHARKQLKDDIALMDQKLAGITVASQQAQSLAQEAGTNGAALTAALATLNTSTSALQAELNTFRSKVDDFATKSGSFIASTALKAVGIA